ncbi:MAG TPA: protein kinase, partial [Mycobacteriales bacterium]|nr:protein kinase [Mycobacteriales bacterium]
ARAAAALRHPNVLGLLGVDGDTLVLPYVPGGSLGAALATGARYAPAQAAALAAGVAAALAAAHAAGLVHGDVKPANVLLDGAGTPLLADFRGAGDPGDDVRALALLAGLLDPALRPLLDGARDAADAHARLVAYRPVVDGDDPEPTRDFGPRPPRPPEPAPPARSRRLRALPALALPAPARAVAVAALVLLLAVLAGWSLPRATSAGALAPAPGPDWTATLAALDAARSAAFARADARGLDAVYAPASAPLAADRALLARYAARRTRVADLHLVPVTVVPVRADDAVAVLEVTDRLLPYTVVDAAGRPVERWPGRDARRWRITLRRVAGQWRIADVRRVPAVPS